MRDGPGTRALEVADVSEADALDNKLLFTNAVMIDRATGDNCDRRLTLSLALDMVLPEPSAVGTGLKIEILGECHAAAVIRESPFDPESERLSA